VSTEASSTTESAAAASAVSEDASAGDTSRWDRRLSAKWAVVERFLASASDWLNPILVKETRQALKSFQFQITFVLVLVACWIVTIAVVASIGPRIFYAAAGNTMLFWYYIVLTFPLLVVVPLAAFRSLASEREDNTYDLLSITTLKSRQIISGKLGSAVAQMGVYLSAITPCLAFTYLLRGVDIPTIAVLIGFTFLWSLALSITGLLLATLTQQRFAQGLILVIFVAVLLLMFYWSILLSNQVAMYGRMVLGGTGAEFWIFTAGAITVFVTFFALAFFAASGMITFLSENRSSPLRICMLVQQAAFVGWVCYVWIINEYESAIAVLSACLAFAYWFVMGSFLTSERPGMSQRVRRSLPQSFLGSVFFSWLNPGPASGYMFAVANATAIALLCFFATVAKHNSAAGFRPSIETVINLLVIGWGYLVAYLGLGLLVISALRRVTLVTMLAGVLINCLLLLAGFGIPTAVKLMSEELRDADYTFLQISDPFWSMVQVGEDRSPSDTRTLLMIVPGVAVCLLLVNMPAVIRELQRVRVAPPSRVLEDEAELHPAPVAGPQSPWDEV
jgi:hypothetical protein